MLEIKHLRLLTAISHAGSLSGAARRLGLSQPAVTQQVQGLERTLGTPLLVRAKGRVQLTEAAQILLRHASGILSAVETAEQEVEALAGLRAGRIRLASFPSAASTILPRALAAMNRDFPGVSFSLVEAEPRRALALLREGGADIALVSTYSDLQADEPPGGAGDLARLPEDDGEETTAIQHADPTSDLRRFTDHGGVDGIGIEPGEVERVLLEERLWVALPTSHPLSDHETVDLADLSADRWIAGCPQCRAHLMAATEEAGFVPDIVFETDDHSALQELTAAGLGVALVTDLMVASRAVRSDYVLRPTTEPRTRRVSAITYESILDVPGIAQTLDALESVARTLPVPER